MFADHLLEVLDRLQINRVFFFTEIDERAGVSAMLRNDHFDRSVWIDVRVD